jgi:major membrane immunogen (membrane-anchored lipoprotein)
MLEFELTGDEVAELVASHVAGTVPDGNYDVECSFEVQDGKLQRCTVVYRDKKGQN